MTKHALRQQILTRRSDMQPIAVELLSGQIMNHLIDLVDWATIHRVHVYQSSLRWNEVSTVSLLEWIAAEVPQVEVTLGEVSTSAAMPAHTYDLIIVPIVAFDANRRRLGFGGGWYDRFLAKQPNAQKIGLAFELQRVDEIPTEPHDVLLDAVVAETRVY